MENVYIRFGDIPNGELSFNYLTGKYEKGVSVFEATLSTKGEEIELNFLNLSKEAEISLLELSGRQIYIVDGDRIGTGSDGEPLLKNCKILEVIL